MWGNGQTILRGWGGAGKRGRGRWREGGIERKGKRE